MGFKEGLLHKGTFDFHEKYILYILYIFYNIFHIVVQRYKIHAGPKLN